MKSKISLLILVCMIFLTGCSAPTPDQILMELNPGIDTVEINTTFIDAGVKASVFGLPVKITIIENTLDMTQIGQYQITYEVDYRGVVKTITRVIFVIDETPPMGILNIGLDTIIKGQTWVDASITATDNSLVEVTVTTSGYVNTNFPGDYMITYVLEDSAGNQSTYYRWVFVIENPN